MEQLKKRDERLDAVKGFAILLVMLGHCIVLNHLSDPYLYDAIAAIQMPLFMAVSGFTAGMGQKALCCADGVRPELKKELARLKRRTISYLFPFFSWLVLTHITDPLQELGLQLFALDRGLWFLMTLWIVTLVVMAAAYLADLAAWKLASRGRKGMVRFLVFGAVLAVCYVGFVIWGRSGNTFLSPSLTVKYLPFYAAGYLWSFYITPFVKKYREKRNIEAGKRDILNGIALGLWIFALLIFGYLIAAFDMVVVTDTLSLMAQMAASFLGSFICFYGIYHFVRGPLQIGLSFIGQYTLEIYVLHFRFARLLGIGEKGIVPGSIRAAGWIMAAFALMSLLTAVCIILIKKVRILDLLLFGRTSGRIQWQKPIRKTGSQT